MMFFIVNMFTYFVGAFSQLLHEFIFYVFFCYVGTFLPLYIYIVYFTILHYKSSSFRVSVGRFLSLDEFYLFALPYLLGRLYV